MDHIAIMKKSWGLMEKILRGEKTVESRWYKVKYSPWNRIKPGNILYFKDSGQPVSLKAKVTKVLQFADLTPEKTEEILEKYGKADLGTNEIMPEIKEYVFGKNYCLLIFFNEVEKIKPFEIDKTGFGTMSAWISLNNVNQIKKQKKNGVKKKKNGVNSIFYHPKAEHSNILENVRMLLKPSKRLKSL